MKTWVYNLSILIIVTCGYTACEDPCYGRSCADVINFKLIDKATQQDLLFGVNPKYKIDSLQLNLKPEYTLGVYANLAGRVYGNDGYLSISTSIPEDDTTYLRLAYNDIDTLSIQYSFEENDCCSKFGGYGKIISIKFNGKTALKEGEYYKFEKE